MAPVGLCPVLPVVSAELVVRLSRLVVVDLLEVGGLVVQAELFSLLTRCSLFVLEASLFSDGQLDFLSFQGSLVCSKTRIGWSNHVLHLLGQVVQVYREVREMILLVTVLGQRASLPDQEGLFRFLVVSLHLLSPLSSNDPFLT